MVSVPTTLLIGYGNPLRGDDGLGWQVAVRYAREAAARPGLRVLPCHQLTPELAESLSEVDRVIFVDATAESPPGEIKVVPLSPDPAAPRSFTHQCDPPGLLASAHALYGHAPAEAWLVTVGGAEFGYCESLSPTLTNLLPRLDEIINGLLAGPAPE